MNTAQAMGLLAYSPHDIGPHFRYARESLGWPAGRRMVKSIFLPLVLMQSIVVPCGTVSVTGADCMACWEGCRFA